MPSLTAYIEGHIFAKLRVAKPKALSIKYSIQPVGSRHDQGLTAISPRASIALMILSVITFGLALPYWVYWSFKYFFGKMEIELYDAPSRM